MFIDILVLSTMFETRISFVIFIYIYDGEFDRHVWVAGRLSSKYMHLLISRANYGKKNKNPGSATITSRSPSQAPIGRGNRQNHTSANLINVRKALRLAHSSPSEVIAMLKRLKNTRTKPHKARLKTKRLVE